MALHRKGAGSAHKPLPFWGGALFLCLELFRNSLSTCGNMNDECLC
nr:MAG TPA: hypothetical protein [Caudoviricetes sp.]